MKRITLNNGLQVLFHQMSNTHSVTVGLYVKAGLAHEKVEGMTHLLEHLHFRKAGKLSQNELYYKMECMGSTLCATTYRDFLKFSMKVTPEKSEECVEIFQNLIVQDEWNDEEYEKEMKVVINQMDECGEYASIEKEARNIIFKNHVLSGNIMGNREKIETVKKSDVQRYKHEIFTSENMLLCITGNVDEKTLSNILKQLQKIDISIVETEHHNIIPKAFHHRKPNIVLKEIHDDNPLDVNISFDITYDEYSKDLITIVNCILGEGVGSKLQKRVREEKGYSSNIASYIEWYHGFAVLHINFSVKKEMLFESLREIVDILMEMRNDISTKDLNVTLPFYTTNYMFYEDDTEEMNFQIAYNLFVLGTQCGSVQLENNEKTKLALRETAKTIFKQNNMCIVILGNTKGITRKSIVDVVESVR